MSGGRAELDVVVCTHNPNPVYLRQVLESLQKQTLPPSLWRLLIVDNLSATPVATLVDLAWHPQARVVREEVLGLTAARLRGIAESEAEVLVFVDDDNVLDETYLERSAAIGRAHPHIGAWSGAVTLRYTDGAPPPWMERLGTLMCERRVPRDVWSNLIDYYGTMPCGAGLCVRRTVAQRYAEETRRSEARLRLDRRGASLSSAGDMDLALTACDAGLGIGLFSGLHLHHLIPAHRTTLAYLERLAEGTYASIVVLEALRGIQPAPEAPKSLARRAREWFGRVRMPAVERMMVEATARGRKAGAAAVKGLR